MRKAVFFDLDGTLLPLDMDEFSKVYFSLIKKSGFLDMFGEGGDKVFGSGLYAIFNNEGTTSNKEAFLNSVTAAANVDEDTVLQHMDMFYGNEFLALEAYTRAETRVRETIDVIKDKGYRLILSTNPVFPSIATNKRIEWAGLGVDEFEYISYYDNSHYCKPKLEYFKEILDYTELKADECYVIGNDVSEDMGAVTLGFEGFLVLDNLIGDLGKVPPCVQGNYSDLLSFAKNLPPV